MEGFCDAFFAIVITLLVLDLRPPELPAESAGYFLGPELTKLWPNAAAYLVSFVNIFIMWVIHHELMRITRRADTRFLYLNGALLLGVALVPFSTGLIAAQALGPGARTAALIYTGVFLWVALLYNLIWRFLSAHPDRLVSTVTRRDRRRISRTYAATLGLFAIAFVCAYPAPLVAIALTMALALFFAIVDRLSGFASEDVANEASARTES